MTLIGTVIALGALLYIIQRQDLHLALEDRARADTDVALRIVEHADASGGPVAAAGVHLLGPGVSVDSVRVVTPAFRTLLEGVPDYVLLLDSTGRTLYSSFAVRQLDPDAQSELVQEDGGIHH